jgi:Protein of unknown function (DUF3768)
MTQSIAELNDAFRSSLIGGEVFMTRGIAALPISVQQEIIIRVRTFDAFGPDNDPHGERDFGSFDVDGKTIFFKIDLYEDPDVKGANGEPIVTRVLTIMLANEY